MRGLSRSRRGSPRRARLPAKWSMSMTAAATARSPSPALCRRPALDVQVVSLSRNFGKEAALLAGLDHARRGAVLFIDGDGQHPPALIETLVGHWLDDDCDVVYTAKANRANKSRQPPRRGESVLYAVQLGRAHENPGRRRRLPAAVAARRQCAPPIAGAQPLLQGAGELDRLSPDAHRLRAGSARRRPAAPGIRAG